MSTRKQWQQLRVEDVAKRLHDKSALQAAAKYYAFRDAGKQPAIWHSKFHGYRVTEDSLPPDQQKTS